VSTGGFWPDDVGSMESPVSGAAGYAGGETAPEPPATENNDTEDVVREPMLEPDSEPEPELLEPEGRIEEEAFDQEPAPAATNGHESELVSEPTGEVAVEAAPEVVAEPPDETVGEPAPDMLGQRAPELAAEPADEAAPEAAAEPPSDVVMEPAPELAPETELEPEAEPVLDAWPVAHAPGELSIPDDVTVLEGAPGGLGRSVGVVVSRFNGEVTNRLLESALEELDRAGVARDRITVMPVPGAFELPLGAMALAKTRRFACIVALGCVIRGETAHFEYVAGEAASGLQLAGLETGVPVAFGVLTVDTLEQAEARAGRGADAVRSALEMADIFQQVRAQAG